MTCTQPDALALEMDLHLPLCDKNTSNDLGSRIGAAILATVTDG
jgi:hypothetical protein